MRAPVAIWVDEKGFSKDIHFFRRKIYLSFRIGFMKTPEGNCATTVETFISKIVFLK